MPPSPPDSPVGHKSWPVWSVIVTFSGFRPSTLEATSRATPRTEPGSSPAPADRKTAAVAGFCSSAKSWSSGSVSCTCAPETPSTCEIVRAISPSSARW
jgi:hypothetical protein